MQQLFFPLELQVSEIYQTEERSKVRPHMNRPWCHMAEIDPM